VTILYTYLLWQALVCYVITDVIVLLHYL